MSRTLDSTAPDFAKQLQHHLDQRKIESDSVAPVVRDIIANVREKGDVALCEYTAKFDRLTLKPDQLRLGETELAQAQNDCDPAVRTALELAAKRIRGIL